MNQKRDSYYLKHEEYYEKDNYMDAINTLDSIL